MAKYYPDEGRTHRSLLFHWHQTTIRA